MSWKVIKQPNSLFGVFSEAEGNFLEMGMTLQDALAYCTKKYGNNYTFQNGTGLDQWRACLTTIRLVHGASEVREIERYGGLEK